MSPKEMTEQYEHPPSWTSASKMCEEHGSDYFSTPPNEECWQQRILHPGYEDSNWLANLQKVHCVVWEDYVSRTLPMCHPSSYSSECEKEDQRRSCYIEDNSPFFTIAYFPWLSQGHYKTNYWGPVQIGTSDPAINNLEFPIGAAGSTCQVCTGSDCRVTDAEKNTYYLQSLPERKYFHFKIKASTKAMFERAGAFLRNKVTVFFTDNKKFPPKSKLEEFARDAEQDLVIETEVCALIWLIPVCTKVKSTEHEGITVHESYVSRGNFQDDSKLLQYTLCPQYRTQGCYAWDNSISFHPCSSDYNIFNTCQNTRNWREKFAIYKKFNDVNRVDTRGRQIDYRGDNQIALYVPHMPNFPGSIKLTVYDGQGCASNADELSLDAAGEVFYIYQAHFKLSLFYDVADADAPELYCQCPFDHTEYLAYGLDSSKYSLGAGIPALHECRMCTGLEIQTSLAGSGFQCGGFVYTCQSCTTRSGNGFFRNSGGQTAQSCIECPAAHVLNTRQDLENLQGLHGYRNETLPELQKFTQIEKTESHIHVFERYLQGGDWTCHICPYGYYYLRSGTNRLCQKLHFISLEFTHVNGDNFREWTLSQQRDQYTIDGKRTVVRTVSVGSYLNIQSLSEGRYNILQCVPPTSKGVFLHLCGRPDVGMYVIVLSRSLNAALTDFNVAQNNFLPDVGDQFYIKRNDINNFYFYSAQADYTMQEMERIYVPDSTSQKAMAFIDSSMYELDLQRQGKVISCSRCENDRYNPNCVSSSPTSEGNPGNCQACTASIIPGSYLSHELFLGCQSWVSTSGEQDLSVFVDSNYENVKCPTVLVENQRILLCVGFCGGENMFSWWKPILAEGDLDQVLDGTGAVVSRYVREQEWVLSAGVVPDDDKCKHPVRDERFIKADDYTACTDEIPYCPPGWFVDTSNFADGCHQLQDTALGSYKPRCCKECQFECETNLRRQASWQQCPGDTTYDTQARCGQGCDINYYYNTADEQCQRCESCDAGLVV